MFLSRYRPCFKQTPGGGIYRTSFDLERPPTFDAAWHKDPSQRVQAIGDMRLALDGAFDQEPGEGASFQLRLWQRPVPAALGVVAVSVATGLAVWTSMSPDSQNQPLVTRFTVPVDGGHEMERAECPGLALSPDGRTLAYVANQVLHMRSLDRAASIVVAGTEGAEGVFFSSDSRTIGFGQNNTLKTVSRWRACDRRPPAFSSGSV